MASAGRFRFALVACLSGCGARTSLPDANGSGAPDGTGGSVAAAGGTTGSGGGSPSAGSGGSGPCQPGEPPVMLASGQMGPESIAIDSTRAYWTDADSFSGRVMSAPLAGGAAAEVATAQTRPRGIALSESQVYWTDALAGLVQRAPKTGGDIEPLGPWQHNPEYVAADDAGVVWTNRGSVSDGQIMRQPNDDGMPFELVSGQHEPAEIASDGDRIFWLNHHSPGAGPGSVRSVSVAGGEPAVLFEGLTNPKALAIDGTTVFFAGVISRGTIDILSIPKAGGAPTVIVPSASALAITVGNGFVYWADSFGNIVRAPISGGESVVLATDQLFVHGLAVDAWCVYWTAGSSGQDSHNGAVWKAPR